jgi:hypothetical protein
MSSKKRSSTKTRERQSARERIAAARAAEKRRERMRWIITFSVTGVVVAALAVGALLALKSNTKKASALPHPPPANGTGQPPWPLPADPVAGARAAGLSIGPLEGTAKHFHAHLDVIVNGQKVPVPANLGIATSGQQLAELHTHDTTGVLHIEAPTTNKRYTLGQLFDEWDVQLTATSIGGLKTDAGHTLTAYVNGKPQPGDPAAIELTAHKEIALVYGPKGQKVNVPSSYKFENGL